ncbi:hypothetical protein KKF84_08535 [Myxococcota bacterium]|nr:hypothetical protein [Myxococcota bacterium]
MLKLLVTKRRVVHAVLAIATIGLVAALHIPLLWVMLFGSLLGIVLGKTFCRWICPMGFVICGFMGGVDGAAKKYQYHKIGCPIAWISGFLNRFSIFQVRRKESLCVSCGKCDKACYITEFEESCSLYKEGKADPSMSQTCSRCLECVKACPTGSLTYKP